MSHYYNEIDPYCAAWLQNLMNAGEIPHGDIDTRSIEDVRPDELAGYVQCHFFAGIAGWPFALALAGWPVDRPVWTGSCPCQPFSAAGKGAGFADQRHLWPVWFHLISQCRPATLFGEQVAAAVGHAWLDGVCADLEGQGYAVGAAVLPACAAGAPHRRDRLWFGAGSISCRGSVVGHPDRIVESAQLGTREGAEPHAGRVCVVADTHGFARRQGSAFDGRCDSRGGEESRPGLGGGNGSDGSLANPDQLGTREERAERSGQLGWPGRDPWARHAWITGHDGKARRVEPSIRLLAHGVPARVGRLRAYGNAIVPEAAAEFIASYAEARGLMLPAVEVAA